MYFILKEFVILFFIEEIVMQVKYECNVLKVIVLNFFLFIGMLILDNNLIDDLNNVKLKDM